MRKFLYEGNRGRLGGKEVAPPDTRLFNFKPDVDEQNSLMNEQPRKKAEKLQHLAHYKAWPNDAPPTLAQRMPTDDSPINR